MPDPTPTQAADVPRRKSAGSRMLVGIVVLLALAAAGFGIYRWKFSAKDEPTLDCGGGVTMELVLVPPGGAGASREFMMGSPDAEIGHDSFEEPLHKVTIRKRFYMGKYPVSEAQFKAVMNYTKKPEESNGPDYPMHYLSYNEATQFCRELSKRTRRTVRLPTEAEWEFACRAGTTTAFAFGPALSPDDATFDATKPDEPPAEATPATGPTTTPASTLVKATGRALPRPTKPSVFTSGRANQWGLVNMHGNVWELCEDTFHDDYAGAPADGLAWVGGGGDKADSHVIRGGMFDDPAVKCRSAYRLAASAPGTGQRGVGLRVVVELLSDDAR